jgi:hypothetical protein
MAKKRSKRVGYKNPPLASQFKPGASGNPKGRPRGSKSLSSLVRKELRERIEVNSRGGRQKSMSKERVMAAQLVNSAIREPKFIPTLIKILGLEASETETQVADATFDRPEDKVVIESIVRRLRQTFEAQQNNPPPDSNPSGGIPVDDPSKEDPS